MRIGVRRAESGGRVPYTIAEWQALDRQSRNRCSDRELFRVEVPATGPKKWQAPGTLTEYPWAAQDGDAASNRPALSAIARTEDRAERLCYCRFSGWEPGLVWPRR